MMKQKVFITGDWKEGADIIMGAMEGSQFEPLAIEINDLKQSIKSKVSDVVIICIKGPSRELTSKITEVRYFNEAIPIFIFSKTVEVDYIVSNIKNGVNDFFVRPFSEKVFIERLEREIHLYQLTKKVFMTTNAGTDFTFENMIGRSKSMQDNFQMISAVAKSHATVLITGESGVGKELVAHAIHKRSERARHNFVDINCGAIPRELLENELFGHEKGAFTGAHKRYLGSFETANKGSLFLDEISEMDVSLQVKLLRAIQERTISRIGSNENFKIDVRIIAATNRNITEMIEENRFREDLYYRLNVVNIDIPPLRERRDDIPLLAKHFLDYYTAKNNKIFLDYANDAMEALINYDWPGNVRELENTVERVVVLHDNTQVKLKHLPPHLQKVDCFIGYTEELKSAPTEARVVPLEEIEKQAIEAALMKFQGNITVAARKLKIGQATLYRKVKKFGLQFT
ncbi:MAG: sigma-54-dependent Fis family transcriptional regulator [Deltaproteobacteria bacterium]|nr:sigma-54-dependent Fis family transcriptional regulator [Deltaproteobacteria bacterium]